MLLGLCNAPGSFRRRGTTLAWWTHIPFGTLPWTSRMRGVGGGPIGLRLVKTREEHCMQKKLLTLAVAGALAAPAVAFAQSSVEVYGYLNMSIGNWSYKGATDNTTNPDVSKWDVTSAASNVGVRGRETLGGGLSAWFQVETNAALERSNNVAHTSGFASRNSAVGVQGNFGNVFLGQWTSPWADLDALWAIGTVGGFGPVTSVIGRRETTGAANNFNCAQTASGAPTSTVGGNC